MQAIGMIETKGLLAAIEGADSMTKSANVTILEKTYVGGGLVTIVVTGDVGAVRAAVDAGVASIKGLGEELLISEHVIPRPHEELNNIMKFEKDSSENKIDSKDIENREVEKLEEIKENIKESVEEESENKTLGEVDENITELETTEEVIEIREYKNEDKKITKEDIEEYLKKNEIEKLISDLNTLKISELRKLLKEHKEIALTGKTISKMDKESLIKKILEIYNVRGDE